MKKKREELSVYNLGKTVVEYRWQ